MGNAQGCKRENADDVFQPHTSSCATFLKPSQIFGPGDSGRKSHVYEGCYVLGDHVDRTVCDLSVFIVGNSFCTIFVRHIVERWCFAGFILLFLCLAYPSAMYHKVKNPIRFIDIDLHLLANGKHVLALAHSPCKHSGPLSFSTAHPASWLL